MPTINIHNRTTNSTLNLALSHLFPIHLKNSVKPGETWSVEVGSVWFTFECRLDKTHNRYSHTKSTQTIGLITLTGASLALVAIPLTIASLAPISVPAAHLITSNSLLAAGASSEVLAVTTWFATTLTKKTIYQLSIERGVNQEDLEKTLKTSSMIIDSIKYATVSNTFLKNAVEGTHTSGSSSTSVKSDRQALISSITGGILKYGSQWITQTFNHQEIGKISSHDNDEDDDEVPNLFLNSNEGWTIIDGSNDPVITPSAVSHHHQVRGVYIGFDDGYEFEWRDAIDDQTGRLVGVQLWDLKLNISV